MSETEHGINRVIYVDPNNQHPDSPENAIEQPYEDYCIVVSLNVVSHDRFGNKVNQEITFGSNRGDNTSFMQGTNGYLSTTFTDISTIDPGSGDYEGLGITSIDISYNSWYFPQVTITFVDVRGSSLMAPQEWGYERTLGMEANNESYSIPGTQIIGGSIFKSLFTFPFPEFNLKVKGFYGNAINLKLCVEKCNIRFNSESGNFEAVVHFIGYLYGLYTDIPMQLISVAPYVNPTKNYNLSNGVSNDSAFRMYNSYWENETSEAGRFFYEGYNVNQLMNKIENRDVVKQSKILTYPELAFKMRSFVENESQISKLTETGKRLDKMTAKANEIGYLVEDCPFMEGKSIGNTSIYENKNVNDDGVTYWCIFTGTERGNNFENAHTRVKEYIDKFKKAAETYPQLNEIIDDEILVRYYDISVSKQRNGYANSPVHAVLKWDKGGENGDKSFIIDNTGKTSQMVNEFIKGSNNYDSFDFHSLKDEKSIKGIVKDEANRALTANSYKGYDGIVAKVTAKCNILKKLTQLKNDINAEIENLKGVSESERGAMLSQTLGFTPTIKNMFKMTLAHLDTFIKLFYDCVDEVVDDLNSGRRYGNFEYGETSHVFTDYQSTKKKVPFPPFTKFFVKSQRTNDAESSVFTELLPSKENLILNGVCNNLTQDIPEIRFVDALLEAAKLNTEIQTAMQKLVVTGNYASSMEDVTKLTKINNFVPVTPFDLNHFNDWGSSPYSMFSNVSDKSTLFGSITLSFFSRLYQSALYSANNDKKPTGRQEDREQNTFGKNFATIEAFNVFLALSDKSDILKNYASDYGGASKKDITECLYNAKTESCNHISVGKILNGNSFFTKNKGKIYYSYSDKLPLNVVNYANLAGSSTDYLNLDEPKNSEFAISDETLKIYGTNGDKINIVDEASSNVKNLADSFNMGPEISESFRKIFELVFRNDVRGEVKWNTKDNYIFTKPIYYSQSRNIDGISCYSTATDYDSENSLYARAYLFLFSNIVEKEYIEKKYDVCQDNGVCYYYGLLREGAVYYADEYFDSHNRCHLIKVHNEEPAKDFIPTVVSNGPDSVKVFDGTGKTGKCATALERDVTTQRKEKLSGLFKEWAKDEEGFKAIERNLALKSTDGKLYEYNYNDEFGKGVVSDNKNPIFGAWKKKLDGKKANSTNELLYSGAVWDYYEFTPDEKKYEQFMIGGKGRDTEGCNGIVIIGEGDSRQWTFYNKNNKYFDPSAFDSKNIKEAYIKDEEYEKSLNDKFTEQRSIIDVANLVSRNVESPEAFSKYVSENVLNDTYSTFCSKLAELCEKNQSANKPEGDTIAPIDDVNKNDDMRLSLYNVLSDLYNKWLAGSDGDKWKLVDIVNDDGKNVMKFSSGNSFFFIDSFYHDISNDIIVNPDVINEVMSTHISSENTGSDEGSVKLIKKSVLEFMHNMAQNIEMTMLALPINFGDTFGKDFIGNMFTANPFYKAINTVETESSSFVCIYTSKPSQHLDIKGQQYRADGFDLTPGEDLAGTVHGPIGVTTDYDLFNGGGYQVPAFGVTYAKGNQSYFKNIDLNMENAQTTEYSIGAMMNIASKAGEADRSTMIYGQDLYRVYSNYSYQCSVEMMGCAQMFPLMYFQLNNIPMWKGAYMVVNVTHSIRPGTMSTKFTGVRVNRYMIPFTKPFPDYAVINDNRLGVAGQNDDSYSRNPGGMSPDNITWQAKSNMEPGVERTGIVPADYFLNEVASKGWTKEMVQSAAREVYTKFTKYQDKSCKNGYCAAYTSRFMYTLNNGGVWKSEFRDMGLGDGGTNAFNTNAKNVLGYDVVCLGRGLTYKQFTHMMQDELMGKSTDYKKILDNPNGKWPYGAILNYRGYDKNKGPVSGLVCRHATFFGGYNPDIKAWCSDVNNGTSVWWADKKFNTIPMYSGKCGNNPNIVWDIFGLIPPQAPLV